jgi:glucan biosynthesis protein
MPFNSSLKKRHTKDQEQDGSATYWTPGNEKKAGKKLERKYYTVSLAKGPTSAQGSNDCFINTLQTFLSRHVSAYVCHPERVMSA